jgi:hypothetical protein
MGQNKPLTGIQHKSKLSSGRSIEQVAIPTSRPTKPYMQWASSTPCCWPMVGQLANTPTPKTSTVSTQPPQLVHLALSSSQ